MIISHIIDKIKHSVLEYINDLLDRSYFMLYTHLNTGRKRDMELYLCDRDADLPPGITYGPVIRDVFIVECCTGGFGGVSVNGRYFPVKKGDCYILFPGDIIIHTADKKEPRSGVWCAIDGFMVKEYLARIGVSSEQPFAPGEVFDGVTAQINEMISLKEDSDCGADLRRSGCVSKMFGELLRFSSAANDVTDYTEHAIRLMEAKYYTDISVSDIAAEVGLERTYFSTVFKNETGVSPYRYLRRLRIKKACLLMTEGGLRVYDAAVAVGIAPESFARAFRSEMGMSPLEYVKISKRK